MIDGQPCRVMDFTHRTPGNLRAFVQVRFRNLVSGNTFDQRLAATDFLQEARLDTKEMQVLYQDQGGVHVMDQQTYEQFTLDERAVGEDTPWLQPEMVVQVEWLDGRPIAIELPSVIELKVVETSPVMKTATKTASTKPAKLSNGVTVQVPEFISHEMIVDHAHGLHERVADRRPHKAKAPLDQRLAHRRGFFRLGWHPAERLPGVDLRFPADKLPEKLIE